jgi:hypothetical protein
LVFSCNVFAADPVVVARGWDNGTSDRTKVPVKSVAWKVISNCTDEGALGKMMMSWTGGQKGDNASKK